MNRILLFFAGISEYIGKRIKLFGATAVIAVLPLLYLLLTEQQWKYPFLFFALGIGTWPIFYHLFFNVWRTDKTFLRSCMEIIFLGTCESIIIHTIIPAFPGFLIAMIESLIMLLGLVYFWHEDEKGATLNYELEKIAVEEWSGQKVDDIKITTKRQRRKMALKRKFWDIETSIFSINLPIPIQKLVYAAGWIFKWPGGSTDRLVVRNSVILVVLTVFSLIIMLGTRIGDLVWQRPFFFFGLWVITWPIFYRCFFIALWKDFGRYNLTGIIIAVLVLGINILIASTIIPGLVWIIPIIAFLVMLLGRYYYEISE